MTALNKQALRYGDNVLWFLNELAAYDASDIDGGEFDVYGDDRNGLEGCSTIDVTELAADAAKLIEAAEKRIAELQIARDKCFLSGLKTGWEYGIADDTEGYNREIDDAQAVIDRAAGIGVKWE